VSRNAALITGAGSSTRMNSGLKKEYRLLDGVPVLARSLTAFQATGLFAAIVVTVPPGQTEQAKDLVAPFADTDIVSFIEGGTIRRESVFLGLQALRDHDIEYVLIHDAARPWITADLVRAVLDGAVRHDAAIPVIGITDALVETGPDNRIQCHLAKDRIRGVQTPQGFRFEEIFRAHQAARDGAMDCYDDAQVLMASGRAVYTVVGDPANRKITYAHDLEGL
jgi:2-C-methyl-D-erythritol 4-phosphate cytidylyltransferase